MAIHSELFKQALYEEQHKILHHPMNFFTEVTVCFEKMHEVDEISYVFSQV
jgi:hypothetical protein